jgi:cysteine synthase A
VAVRIVDDAESKGVLIPRPRGAPAGTRATGTLYEGSSGSTAISFAHVCQSRGYDCHVVMPSDVSLDKSKLLSVLGATVERVPPAPIADRMQYSNRAQDLAAADPNGYYGDQFENDVNWRAHYDGTALELWEQTGGKMDAVVLGAGECV